MPHATGAQAQRWKSLQSLTKAGREPRAPVRQMRAMRCLIVSILEIQISRMHADCFITDQPRACSVARMRLGSCMRASLFRFALAHARVRPRACRRPFRVRAFARAHAAVSSPVPAASGGVRPP